MSPRDRLLRRRVEQGYTLSELMIAVLLTSLVVGALYRTSRSASETFNQQQRIAETQLRLRFAAEQLRADIARAGYMATPNSATDPKVCPRPTQVLQALSIERDAPSIVPLATDNQFISPVVLRMTGNYLSVDEYMVAGVDPSSGEIRLQNQTPQWARMTAEEFTRIFLASANNSGRMVRITSPTGEMQFALVVGGSFQSANSTVLPVLRLQAPPTVVGAGASSSTAGAGCGISGLGVGATVAPITMVEYRLMNLSSNPVLADLSPTDPVAAARKTDLVRVEYDLQPQPVLVPGSMRVVGEFAVDFDATVTVDDGFPIGSATGPVTLRSFNYGDTDITTLMANVQTAGLGTARPQRVRSVSFRLSIRERDQDPGFGWVARASGAEALTRYRVFDNRIGAARVRTVATDVVLPNLATRNLR
ncbi:MAG: prepilin-type N-terminal cleavage/methylation domain-containing protein [Myxococcales bacterium]|nr:prepilin-type N-terminal cleavage/methylation domain-containing protein [Myxococcales bacterium]